jgi:hypothetical protein
VSALLVSAAAFNATKCCACTALSWDLCCSPTQALPHVKQYSPLAERGVLDFPVFPAGGFHGQKKIVNIYMLGAAEVETDDNPSGNFKLFSRLFVCYLITLCQLPSLNLIDFR